MGDFLGRVTFPSILFHFFAGILTVKGLSHYIFHVILILMC